MRGYVAFTKKEFMENARNFRLMIMLLIFFIFGVLSPLTAKFTPELISAFVPEMQITFNEPSAIDSWIQFYKNISSLGFSLMIIIFSNMLSSEYAKGTLVIMLTKGMSRPMVILSKFSAAVVIMSISLWMSFGVTVGYTAYFWQSAELIHTVFAAFSLWISGILYLCILMLGCVLFRQAFAGIIFLLGVNVVFTLLGMLKSLEKLNPFILSTKNVDLISGTVGVSEFILPIVVSLIISAGCLVTAIALFNKKQV